MEISFPIEFLVRGTPVSFQAKNATARDDWKGRVKAASVPMLPQPHFASDQRMAVTLYYLPDSPMPGDVDNIVKLVLDALSAHIYLDDAQVERVVVQKFEPGNVFSFSNPSAAFVDAITGPKPVLYVRVSDDPFEELR
jgi:crossover junction endodeoxyribonuclease RusA